ncbi:hypothetical protein GGI12_003490 [Dipsacomyces acuminosporus]|nr:hypothetical protein GGI12_003490 [Dipsacomyces acuminosporus]
MCGIQVSIQRRGTGSGEQAEHRDIWTNLTEVNSRRGPDSHNELDLVVSGNSPNGQIVDIKLGAHVLHLRGPDTERQPIVGEGSSDVFCWNGEVFSGLDLRLENDGRKLFERIQALKAADPQGYILQAFSEIEGPYAFVYLDYQQRKLWFARDFLGRRSLLMKQVSPDMLFISSVADGIDVDNDMSEISNSQQQNQNQNQSQIDETSLAWVELPAQKIYCLNLDSSGSFGLNTESTCEYTWHYRNCSSESDSSLVLPFDQVCLDHSDCISTETQDGENAKPLPLECCNFAAFAEMEKWQPYVDRLKKELSDAIRVRVESIPYNGKGGPRVGILFSGGVDCITIAALLTSILPKSEPIELFNVAFENPRQVNANKSLKKGAGSSTSTKNIYDVPDRKTGRQGWLELCRIDPEREWRFVEVDVPYSDVLEYKSHIRQLLVPSDTVMDMSIGMAIWFASRGTGNLVAPASAELVAEHIRSAYTGVARVLLLGMGADEQLGGYSRHRSAWERGGWKELGQEIRLDVQRIATRNLGRDDRIVSDSSKESRYPFLAANVVRFLSSVPLDRKMDMRYARGYGEKLLLRLLAYQLGLANASALAKRAIQFGARTAKMESSHTKGHTRL